MKILLTQKSAFKVAILFVVVFLVSCRVTGVSDAALCKKLENQWYFSQSLGEGGLGPDGIWLMHWSVQFTSGEMLMSQSDFGMTASYECVGTEVLVTSGNIPTQILRFNKELSVLTFNPLGKGVPAKDDLRYIQTPKRTTADIDACEAVRGKKYSDKNSVALSALNTSDTVAKPPASTVELSFDSNQKADVYEYGEAYSGVFDCDLGVLHIHRDVDDIKPIIANVNSDATTISIEFVDRTVKLFEKTDSCTATENSAVCAAKDTGIRCITTPCPSEAYQTYSSDCSAKADGARVLFTGTCGDLEGKPVEDLSESCTKENSPVCGTVKDKAPCMVMPCPAAYWRTFGNDCFAKKADAEHLLEGKCKNEGDKVLGLENGICPAIYAPVCAKDEYQINCLVAPCSTHKYQTFSNSCAAAAAFAEIAFTGECGANYQDLLAFGQPLVKLENNLAPDVFNSTIISSSIDKDIVYVTLGYSGCSPQHFDLQIGTAFRESYPVQASYQFIPQQVEGCLAAFETKFEYDLLPLKAYYQKSYQAKTGSINLGKLGLYEF